MVFEKYKQTFFRLLLVAAMSFALSLILFRPASAAEYNCGAYGRGDYGNGQVCAASSEPGSGEQSGGGLVNTGQALSFGIPALMIIAGTVVLFRLNRKKKADA